jgi:flagellar basal-body rod protein FlgB
MAGIIGGLLTQSDRLQMATLDQRLVKNQVITSNIANSETPGFRALGYDFEEQINELAEGNNSPVRMKMTSDKHFSTNIITGPNGTIHPDVYVRPTESIPQDGNTVDVDKEMTQLAENQVLYRTAVELLNRKLGSIRYAISGGGK